jgi:2-hydroxymuconate-semialdehyde hydrolase
MMLRQEVRTIDLPAGGMAYVDAGEGPVVVLLHGFPTSSVLWRRETWLLAQRMRVIAPDLLGYGASEKPAGADLSEPAQARLVEELLGRLGVERAAVVGHDIGGAVAQMVALGGSVEVPAMVLVDAACFDAWPIEGMRMIQRTTPEQESASFVADLVRTTFELGMGHPDRLDPEALASFTSPWLHDPAAFFRAARAVTGEGLAGRDEALAALDVPTLVLWGEDDPFLAAELAERLGETLPRASVALLPGCSHFVMEDAPQTVGPLISEFLRSSYLGERHSHAESREPVSVFLERPAEPFFDRGVGEEG